MSERQKRQQSSPTTPDPRPVRTAAIEIVTGYHNDGRIMNPETLERIVAIQLDQKGLNASPDKIRHIVYLITKAISEESTHQEQTTTPEQILKRVLQSPRGEHSGDRILSDKERQIIHDVVAKAERSPKPITTNKVTGATNKRLNAEGFQGVSDHAIRRARKRIREHR